MRRHRPAKWGFYKFPLSPDRSWPKVPDELLWREVHTEVPRLTGEDQDYLTGCKGRIALGFDLNLPLRDQLEDARDLLATELRRLTRSGDLPPRTVKASREHWTLYLRFLDAEAEGASKELIAETLFPGDENDLQLTKAAHDAHLLRDAGYTQILLMPEG